MEYIILNVIAKYNSAVLLRSSSQPLLCYHYVNSASFTIFRSKIYTSFLTLCSIYDIEIKYILIF